MGAIRVWVGNLGRYAAGELVGEWVDLPADDDEWAGVMDRIGVVPGRGETFAADYECDVEGVSPYDMFGEFPDMGELNEFAARLVELDDHDVEVLGALVSYGVADPFGVLGDGEYHDWPCCESMADVAYAYVAEYWPEVDRLAREMHVDCFDYAEYGEFLASAGTFIAYNGGYVELFD